MLHCRHSDQDDCPTSEARCACGHLVAKLRSDGVELKCKRCKRLIVVPFARLEAEPSRLSELRKEATAQGLPGI
jgi:phage FluMu protein Com